MADKRKPVFIARAKENPDSDRWMSIGAVWEFKEGDGYAVRLNSLPVVWDGVIPPFFMGSACRITRPFSAS